MLADFRFNRAPRGDEVQVQLYWAGQTRMGRIVVPAEIANAITVSGIPEPGELPIGSALGYAVVLAMQGGRSLCLTGDRSVWNPQWGRLVDVH